MWFLYKSELLDDFYGIQQKHKFDKRLTFLGFLKNSNKIIIIKRNDEENARNCVIIIHGLFFEQKQAKNFVDNNTNKIDQIAT